MQTDWTPPRGPVPTETLTNALTTLHSHSRGVPMSTKHVQTMLPTLRHPCQITRPHLPQYFRHYVSGPATHNPQAGTHNLRLGTVLGRAIVRNWDAPSSSGHARTHLERSWDAPLSAPGALHPRAGTHECTWNDPGTRRLDLGQIILEQARTECSWNSPGTHYAHQPRAGTHGMHLERSWDAPFSGPGKHHPRVGTSACLALDLATGPGDPPGSDSAGAIF